MPKTIRRKDFRVTLDNDGQLDELFCHADIHLERMDDNQWWMGINLPEGRSLRLTFGGISKRSKVKVLLMEDTLACESWEAQG